MNRLPLKSNDNAAGASSPSLHARAAVILKYRDGTSDTFKFCDPDNAFLFAKRSMKRKDVIETHVQSLT